MTEAIVSCDERGRLVLPRSVRTQYGTSFHIVSAKGEVILLPVSKDPFHNLAQIGKTSGVASLSLKQVKEELRKQAEKEI